MNYESPYTIWWDKHIQGKYGLSATVRELIAMAFEGGRQSRDAEIEAEIEALKEKLELAGWDEDAWKKFKQDNYEVIELKKASKK
jgi:hypothetical protein